MDFKPLPITPKIVKQIDTANKAILKDPEDRELSDNRAIASVLK